MTEAPTQAAPPLGGGGSPSQGGFGGTAPISYPAGNLLDNSTLTSDNLYGQSIFRSENWNIYGSGAKKTNSQCGVPHRIRVCSKEKGHFAIIKHICCNDPLCPVCYPKFSCRLADGVSERILGYKQVYPEDPVSHTVFSPPKGTRYTNLKDAFGDVTRIFLRYGGKAGVFWHHPYRILGYLRPKLFAYQEKWERENSGKKAPGFWKLAHLDVLKLGGMGKYVYYSPHFHGLTSGKLLQSDEFYKATKGWIYKKVARDEGEDLPVSYSLSDKDINRVSHYLSTHTAYEWTKHSVRYVGDISYAKLGRRDRERRQIPALCPKCGAPMVEHLINQMTGEIGDICEKEVMERMIIWQYYKRPPRKKKIKEMIAQSLP